MLMDKEMVKWTNRHRAAMQESKFNAVNAVPILLLGLKNEKDLVVFSYSKMDIRAMRAVVLDYLDDLDRRIELGEETS
jgi:hypothetical protein